MFPEFADQCVYLDIETTGLSSVFDRITVVGLYDGRKYKVFVDGENLDELPDSSPWGANPSSQPMAVI